MEMQCGCSSAHGSSGSLASTLPPAQPATVPLVHVIDDDDSFRVSMTRMLSATGLAVAAYGCAGEFLLRQREETCGCILLDISMPGPSGIDLLRALVARGSAPPIIFVTGRDDVLTSVDVMKSGAFDYIVKPVGANRVLAVVHRALAVDAERVALRRALLDLRARFELLTNAERRILFGVLRNRLNKQIAGDLGACERTIKAQRARMMEKLQAKSVPELVRAAQLLERSGVVIETPSAIALSMLPPKAPSGLSSGLSSGL